MARRTQAATPSALNPNLTPLLDVVLQLITFLMMLVHFGTNLEESNKAIRLPVAPAALPGSDLTFDRLTVVLNARGQLIAAGRVLDDDAATKWWANQAKMRIAGLKALSDPSRVAVELPTIVILRADRAVSYGAVRRTLAEAQGRGFVHFSLVVLRRRTP
jgi:biopolymer transport protein ExbD